MNKTLAFITALFVIAAFSLVIITQQSCQKPNTCGNLSCNNGGTCGNGICLCAPGYTGVTCDTPAYAQYTGTYIGVDNFTGNNVADTIVVTGVPGSPDSVSIGGLAASFNLSAKLYIPIQNITYKGVACSVSGGGNFTPPNLTYTVTITSINSNAINVTGSFNGTM